MFKNIKEYNFRNIVGHFVLMKNTKIVNNPEKYKFIDQQVEEIKQDMIRNTKDYYKATTGYDEELDTEDTFSLDALNEDMTTRKVADLYEPVYGYIGVEKIRGILIYFLGNEEDKLKYVYSCTCNSYTDKEVDNLEIEVIDESDYPYSLEFKNQIEFEEERDEEILKTRELTILDPFRLENFPDFVYCIVPFEEADYNAKVKLEKVENKNMYTLYHNQEGILYLIQEPNSQYLLFKPIVKINKEKALKEYIDTIITILKNDWNGKMEDILFIMNAYASIIEKCFIKGDLPFEAINEIMNRLRN